MIGTEGHRVHLNALAHKERDVAYQRQDYLSREWQLGLWKDEFEEPRDATTPDLSPVSASVPPHSVVSSEAPSKISVLWREKIVEWKYELVDQFGLDREIVSISTFYLDRYLSMNYVDKQLFQLVAMTCIYLAIKIHSRTKVTIVDFAALGNGHILPEHIKEMELSIMSCLDWHLFPPTPATFVQNFLAILSENGDGNGALDVDEAAHSSEFSRFLAELSVCAYPFISARPSSVAIAAILYSFERLGRPENAREAFRTLLAEDVTTSSLDMDSPEVRACGKLLRRVYHLAVPDVLRY